MQILVPVLFFAATLTAQGRQSLDGPWEVRPESEPSAWRPVVVPSAFETALGTRFDGVAIYRRALPLPKDKAARTRIEFAAVATHAIVTCNGTKVGEHLGGWTPFRVDVTAALRHDGTDTIEVRVDEKVGHNTQGFLPIIQPHFGGIWQGVTLCSDAAPVLDRQSLFAFATVDGTLRFGIDVLPCGERKGEVVLDVVDGDSVLATARGPGPHFAGSLTIPNATPWWPDAPKLYTLRVRALDGEAETDRVERRIGCRDLRAEGQKVLWNGTALQVRGILHWGYSPPHLAPPVDPAFWRHQLEGFRARGFNLLKCCLWVPPRCVYELADELGMLVWQEYPTWHPQMDQAHKQELLTEYAEFFVHDRSHAAVAFRSITCETGHGADLDVVQALYSACKAAVPDTLVVDDSSWIGWQRVTDFWDEHPYGNNSWLPGRLAEFERHIRDKGEKPLLLGECIAADTWVDAAAWRTRYGDEAMWWRPDCWTAQQTAEPWLLARSDAATLASLRPLSLDFALRNRKFQIEQLRLRLPHAGYVVSVARDFAKARMGLLDDYDQWKWTEAQWAWHGDTMLCLDAGHDQRTVHEEPRAVRVSHFGRTPLRGELVLQTDQPGAKPMRFPVELPPGATSEPFALPLRASTLTRVRLSATLSGTHPATNHWDLWAIPDWHYRGTPTITELTPAMLDRLEAGAHLVLEAGPRPGSPRTEAMWFLKGAPFAFPYRGADRLPPDFLLETCSFDLESGHVLPWAPWFDEFDPLLAFWETHDVPEVRFHLLAGVTRVGKGRLLVTSLNLSGNDAADTNAHRGRLHARELLHNLLSQHEPKHALSPATLATLRAQLTEKKIELPTWRFRTDADDAGSAGNWQDPSLDVAQAPWRDLRAGSHWENQGDDLKHFTGVAWYRVDIEVPADWNGLPARVVFDGVDDSFHCWCNGELVGTFGDPATQTTIWLQRQVAELGQTLRAGQRNTLVLRVVDHAGAGGLWKPVHLTTGPAGAPLLH